MRFLVAQDETERSTLGLKTKVKTPSVKNCLMSSLKAAQVNHQPALQTSHQQAAHRLHHQKLLETFLKKAHLQRKEFLQTLMMQILMT